MKYVQSSQIDFICVRACLWSARGRHGFLVHDTGDSRNSSVAAGAALEQTAGVVEAAATATATVTAVVQLAI